MPFTVAHTGIVLPLKKWRPHWFSLSGLMAGAMAPDLIYFLLLNTAYRGFSHSWSGLFVFDIPAGTVFAFAFHYLFKYHFITNLPYVLAQRLGGLAQTEFTPRSARAWVVLVYSVGLGVLTHFGWDSFTHARGEIAVMLPFLTEYTTLFGEHVRWTTVAQHASTVVGFLMLGWFLVKGWNLPLSTGEIEIRTPAEKIRFWIGAGAVATAVAVGAVWFYGRTAPELAPYPTTTFGLGGFAGFFWAVAGYTVMMRVIERAPATVEQP